MKIAIILGTRPQIIKSAPVISALNRRGVRPEIINTGQHYDYEMNREFFKELSLPSPTLDLGIGKGTPLSQVTRIPSKLGRYLDESKPDVAIVPGDTNSALAAGLACSKEGVPVAHLEAGCRSRDFQMQEEINRRILDNLASVLLCPTRSCYENVKREGLLARVIQNVGDTMYDSIIQCMPSIEESRVLSKMPVEIMEYALMTLHRAETVDDSATLSDVISGVGRIDSKVLFSIHPRTQKRLREFRIKMPPNVVATGPLSSFDMLNLVQNSQFVITDSGGLQKEAFWLGKPSIIVRRNIEWVELVEAGVAFLSGTDRNGILSAYRSLRLGPREHFNRHRRIFGDGKAGDKVAALLKRVVRKGDL